ncbi:S8 family serine peptidase [Actinomycetes bacterium NPDC127524]
MKPIAKKILSLGVSLSLASSPFFSHHEVLAKGPAISKAALPLKSARASLNGKLQNANAENYSDDTLVVKYSKPLSAADHQLAGSTVIRHVSGLNYVVVKVKNKKDFKKAFFKYQKNKKVESVNVSPIYKALGTADPKTDKQYSLSLLHINEAQKMAGKNKVTVAVIDQGIDRNHSELKGSLLPSYNVVNPMNPANPDFHGTHVAGIIAAKKGNGIGGYGVNPNVNLLSVDVFDRQGGAYDYNIAQGVLYAAEKGAKVINLSLGGGFPSPVLEEAIKKVIAKGVVVVAASGNDGMETRSYPASYEGVICVGSVDSKKKLSYFSNYGASTDIVAPGEDIYAPIYDNEKKSTFGTMSGTSMSTPVVAGAASLLLSKYPKLTPAQVEYILEQTSTDLGASGYDIKYGNGLVNPVAALKYDINKLPAFVKEKWSEDEIFKKAEVIKPEAGASKISGSITKPYQQNWVKFHVEKGEYIQANLSSSSPYDYKVMVNFFGDIFHKQELEINDSVQGKNEAKLIQAPFTGDVAIGVKDVNGNFDKSRSKYSLSITKTDKLPEDESSKEAPIDMKSVPGALHLTGEEGDDDYFTFKSGDTAQLMKFSASGIPGVNIGLEVYDKASLFPPADDGSGSGEGKDPKEGDKGSDSKEGDKEPALTEDEKSASDDSVPAKEEEIPSLYSANNGGKGDGETITFMAEPNTEYYVKVTSKKLMWDDSMSFIEFITMLLSGMSQSEQEPGQSLLPYQVHLDSKTLPEDEDGLPGEEQDGEDDGGDYDADKEYEKISSSALPYELGGTLSGYIQNEGDEDWYSFTADKTGIYKFDLPGTEGTPILQISEVIESKDEDGKIHKFLNPIGLNVEGDFFSFGLSHEVYTGLKAGKTYYLTAAMNPFSSNLSFDPYHIKGEFFTKAPGDAYEENDTPEQAKTLPKGPIEGNFSMPNDTDTFYLAPSKTAIYGVDFQRKELTDSLKARYPQALLAPFFGFVAITEDTNLNHKLDGDEYEKTTYVEKMDQSGFNYGSFKAEKGKRYFVTLQSYIDSASPLTLWPYKLTVAPVNLKDEDASSKVRHNTPSKPLQFKKVNSKTYSSSASLNAGVGEGDEDWFAFTSVKTQTGVITLKAGNEIDGVIEVYKNGKRVAYSDYYAQGDSEILSLNLSKGTYYIKVRDSKGNASFNQYGLTIALN